MADSPSDPPNASPRPNESWDRDDWKEQDAWDRDDWKNADWGERPAPQANPSPTAKKSGLASYGAGMLEAGPYLTLGLQIASGMAFFVGIGYFVDKWLDSTPWGMIAGAALGMVAAFSIVIRMAREADAKMKDKRRQRG